MEPKEVPDWSEKNFGAEKILGISLVWIYWIFGSRHTLEGSTVPSTSGGLDVALIFLLDMLLC